MDFSTPGDMLCEMGDIVASRKGCVDFSIKQESVNVSIKGSHLARDAWILALVHMRLRKSVMCRISQGMRGF